MTHIAVIGSGISGVTTAYELSRAGYTVTVIDRNLYPAMDTSFANGGQLSASNAEVWNQPATVFKGIRWMLQPDAPFLVNPLPSWHKYSWMGEFLLAIRKYELNTITTTQMAIEARKRLFAIAQQENIQFDLQRRGILHIYYDRASFVQAEKANTLLKKGGLERYAVTPSELKQIETSLQGEYYGGFYTPSDATGDIHKFTRGLAKVCERKGVTFYHGQEVINLQLKEQVEIRTRPSQCNMAKSQDHHDLTVDAIVICGGVGSKKLAEMAGDRLNVYPVKGYSITVHLDDEDSVRSAPWTSLLDESAKIVTSRLGADRFRVAGTAEFNGENRDIRADRIAPLTRWVNRNFSINTSRVVPWAGLRPMMPDMMPRVRRGRHAKVYYNTGHGHLGWTLSAATAAQLLTLIEQDVQRKVSVL
ncbi:MAG TPA: D-amino acid dehydrogenase [Pusillimonas sp.]|nr:D-amino acid dehydrogenase [Pusillimonas sp.]